MIVRADGEQLGPQLRLGGQVEAVPRAFGQHVRDLAFLDRGHDQLRAPRLRVENLLLRNAVDLGKHRPQRLMAPGQVAEGRS